MAQIPNLVPVSSLTDIDLSLTRQDTIDKKYSFLDVKRYLGVPDVGITPYMTSLLDDANATTARATLGVTYSTQAQAEAGTNDTTVSSPLKVKQYYQSREASDAETETGTSTDKHVTPASLKSLQATETVKGLIAKATKFEAEAGADNTKVMTPLRVNEALSTQIPVGMPMPWPLALAPSGWLECSGQSFNTTTYPKLAIAYPSGVLPDLRGEFIRGWDNGRGVDIGRGVLTAQGDAIRNIVGNTTSNFQSQDSGAGGTNGAITVLKTGPLSTYSSGSDTVLKSFNFDASKVVPTAADNRPRNVSFMYIVRLA